MCVRVRTSTARIRWRGQAVRSQLHTRPSRASPAMPLGSYLCTASRRGVGAGRSPAPDRARSLQEDLRERFRERRGRPRRRRSPPWARRWLFSPRTGGRRRSPSSTRTASKPAGICCRVELFLLLASPQVGRVVNNSLDQTHLAQAEARTRDRRHHTVPQHRPGPGRTPHRPRDLPAHASRSPLRLTRSRRITGTERRMTGVWFTPDARCTLTRRGTRSLRQPRRVSMAR